MLGLSFLVLTLLILYVLPRSSLGWGKGVAIAAFAGLAFVLQISHSFVVPEMYANAGKGRANPACPSLVYGPDGKLVFVKSLIIHEGKPRNAMVAQKHVYLVEPTPYTGVYNGEASVGLLLRNHDALGDTFPVYCSAALSAGGQAWLDRINAYGTPVNHEMLKQILVSNWSPDFWQGIVEGKIKPSQMSELLALYMGNELLPANAKDLARAIQMAAIDVLKPNHDRGVAEMRKVWRTIAERLKAERGIDLPLHHDFPMAGTPNGHYAMHVEMGPMMVEYILMDVTDEAPALMQELDYTKRLVAEVWSQSFADIGIKFAETVSTDLERLGVNNRQPAVTMPGEAPWYLLPESDGQEGDADGDGQSDGKGKAGGKGKAQSDRQGQDGEAEALRQKLLEVMKQQGLEAGSAQAQLDGMQASQGQGNGSGNGPGNVDVGDPDGLGGPQGDPKPDSERF
ncbi:MAG: hypothetical protein GC134_05690 [Proteobacteria bacterium]|nr:hypothetical protein [Pseudomonadota bacterium]